MLISLLGRDLSLLITLRTITWNWIVSVILFEIIKLLFQKKLINFVFFFFKSLIEKHFPAPDRNRIQQMLARQGLIDTKPKTILDELGISAPSSNGNGSSLKDSVGKRKAKRQALQKVKKKAKLSSDEESESSNDDHGSDFEISNDDEDDEDEAESDEFANSDDEDDFNPFGSGSESDEVRTCFKYPYSCVNNRTMNV
jgi:hypothetical protein